MTARDGLNKLPLAIWMLGWPWLMDAYPGDVPKADIDGIAAVFFVIWVVGCLILYPWDRP